MSLITVEKKKHVALLTMDRPDALNALGASGDGLLFEAACNEVNMDSDIRCVILTGGGKAFSAGGDLKAMRDRRGSFSGSALDVHENYRKNIHKIVRAVYHLEVPCIAAVNGAAIGLGCDIACMADIRIASATARFGVTFLKLGLVPGDGGAWLLPRTIGMSRAAELLFSADVIDAQQALEWGLVNRVVDGPELMGSALKLANKISENPPHALRLAKSLLRQGQTASLDTILEMSAYAQALSHMTEDHMEGVDAILSKRTATFNGR